MRLRMMLRYIHSLPCRQGLFVQHYTIFQDRSNRTNASPVFISEPPLDAFLFSVPEGPQNIEMP